MKNYKMLQTAAAVSAAVASFAAFSVPACAEDTMTTETVHVTASRVNRN